MQEEAMPFQTGGRGAHLRGWAVVSALLALATLLAAWADGHVSLTSQAMIYLLAVVLASYRLGWLQSLVCAAGAVGAFNFFFVPPRFTLHVGHRDHFIALAAMLAVALLISHLASSLRRESRQARRNEARARQLQSLASNLGGAGQEADVLVHGQAALQAAFDGPCALVLADGAGRLRDGTGLPDTVRDGLLCCMAEVATLGPGTDRWPELDAWYIPLGGKGQVLGAACVKPAAADDPDAQEHAQALCALLSQALGRLRLASAMRSTQAEAQHHEIQNRLLAAVSHDLRTPLAAIAGAASALQSQRDRLSLSEQDRLLASIGREAAYLSNVTDNTLQLVRLSGSTVHLRRDWESMEEIVGAVLSRVRQRDPLRRIRSRVAAHLPLIKADPVLLSQLLGNLLDNALKYSEGPVDLTVSIEAAELCLYVKDRGPGLSTADEANLFTPYVRGDQGQGQRGTGLGLAVCRAIAHAHGASLTVRRRSGGGCSFCLRLPIDAQQPAGDAL
jgi:two-component system sensor histidine kinase KdpD